MSKFEDLTDKELEQWMQLAQVMQDGRYIKAIRAERSRRNRDE